MQVWKDYQEKNKDRFLNELLELLRIPSVSAKAENKSDEMTKVLEFPIQNASLHIHSPHSAIIVP